MRGQATLRTCWIGFAGRRVGCLIVAGVAIASTAMSACQRVEWQEGHGDITANLVAGEWRMGVQIDAHRGMPFRPEQVSVVLRDSARLAIPNNPNFLFLGEAGEPIWVAPQVNRPGVPDVGLNANDTPPGVLEGNRFDLVLTRVEGPGDFFLWTTGSAGLPIVHMDSSDGLSAADRYGVSVGGHFHMNWGFTSPGTHQLGLVAQGTLADGSALLQGRETLYQFEVNVLKRGEVDIDVVLENGALRFAVHDEGTDKVFPPAHVALQAGPATWNLVPEDPAFGFMGAGGTSIHVLPQSDVDGVLYLGLGAEDLPVGVFRSDEVAVRLVEVDGPGEVYYYEVDALGMPEVFFNSADGLSGADQVLIQAGSHAHRNWAFSKPGVYRLSLQASGQRMHGGHVEGEPTEFLFEVFAPHFFEEGEVDLEWMIADGELTVVLLDEVSDRLLCSEAVVLRGRAAGWTRVPDDPAYAFLGASGQSVHILPQSETEGLLFLGLATDAIEPGMLVDDELRLHLVETVTPGEFALYTVDVLGVPDVAINTRDGLTSNNLLTLRAGEHSHANWAFSEPGVYRLTFAAEGVLEVGQEPLSSLVTLVFWIEPRLAPGPELTLEPVDDGLVLQWDSVAGMVYQLEARVENGDWATEGDPIAGDGGIQSLVIPLGQETVKLFRLAVSNP